MYNSLFLRLQPATLLQIILSAEAKLHKLTPDPSKAKNLALARMALVAACAVLFAVQSVRADIVIDSGAGKDTVIWVSPGTGNENGAGEMIIEPDADNASLIHVSPPPANPEEEPQLPLIIVPEIRIRN
jgi:hypothetical protein